MSLLGTFWDVQRARTIGGSNAASTLTYAHSLGTTPDLVLPVLKSVQRLSLAPTLICDLGNASLATVGLLAQSIASASTPTVAFDLYVAYVWSMLR